MIFLGPSDTVDAITPSELYESYGICAYNLASEDQPLLAAYYWLEEAYRLHSDTLTTVVLDVYEFFNGPESSSYHKALDGMAWSLVKLRAAWDYADCDLREALSFLVPIFSYHDRWTSIEQSDFEKAGYSSRAGMRGYHLSTSRYMDYTDWDSIPVQDGLLDETAEPTEIDGEKRSLLNKMIEFCAEHDLQLVLMKSPRSTWSSADHNAVQQIADDSQLVFLDFNFGSLMEDLDVNFAVEMESDAHTNYYAAHKLTEWLAPLGISYFTLSLVGYVADVYWEIDEAERNPFRLLLFAAYFPKILEGPISRHRLTAQQLNEGHSFEYRRFCFGLQRMLWGYCEKLVIADRIAILTETVLDNYTEYHGAVLLVTMILSAFELYCDFCGCMDIALGASEALGITLEENFRRPFFSQTGAELWRRWHITLGNWFRDYVFLPIGHSALIRKLSDEIRTGVMKIGTGDADNGSRELLARRKRQGKRASRIVVTIIQTSAVWLLTGLWHATGWNYVLWGVYWGALLICSSVLEPEIRRLAAFLRIPTESAGWKVIRQLRTFLLFFVGMIFCLPSTLEETAVIFRQILFHFNPWELFDGTLLTLGLGWPNLILMVGMLIVLWGVEWQQEKGVRLRDRIAQLPVVPRWCIYLGGIFFVLIFGVYGADYDAASFIYMGF